MYSNMLNFAEFINYMYYSVFCVSHSKFFISICLYINFSFYNFSRILSNASTQIYIDTDACSGTETEVNYLEHVQAIVTLNATRRGDVTLFLISPMGTRYVTYNLI